MRTRLILLAAAGFLACSLAGVAGADTLAPQSGMNRADADDVNLKSTGPSKLGRTADEEKALKPTGSSQKFWHALDDDQPLKPAGASKPARSVDEDPALKPAGASGKPGRKAEEITPLRASGGINRPTRIEDDGSHK
jgi:hypothetical protein